MCLKPLNRKLREIRKEDLKPFLNSKIPKVRQVAQDRLENPPPKYIFWELIRLILGPVHKKMMLFRDSLIEEQKKQRYPSLQDSLSSSDITEKETAIKELANFPDQETNKLITDQLLNGPPSVRLTCVETLWKMGMKDAIEPLKISLLSETDCFTRVMISLCLFSLGDTSSFDTIFDDIAENSIENDHWDMTDLVYSGLMPELGKGSIPFLEDGLRHSDWHVRWISLRLIYNLTEPKEALGKYSFLKDDPNSEIRGIYDELLN